MKKTLKLCLPLLFILMMNVAFAADKDKYRPYPHDYPQIIQENDYNTIKAVEALFSEIKKMGDSELTCETTRDSILLKRSDAKSNKITITVPEKGPVTLGTQVFRGQKQATLFSALRQLLADLSKERACAKVKYEQFPTRAYKRRTIIEFEFGSQVVTLDAFSNGPKNEERLYLLDLVHRKESFFWGE